MADMLFLICVVGFVFPITLFSAIVFSVHEIEHPVTRVVLGLCAMILLGFFVWLFILLFVFFASGNVQ